MTAILFPVFGRARENARRSSCQSNAKQILLGITQYAQDYDEKYNPMFVFGPVRYWPKMIAPYLKSTQIYNCPSSSNTPYLDDSSFFPHYGLNTKLFEYDGITGLALSQIQQPAATVFLADSPAFPRVNPEGFATEPSYNAVMGWPAYRHLETTTVGFADGHVKSMRKSALEVKATDENGFALTGDDQFTLWNSY